MTDGAWHSCVNPQPMAGVRGEIDALLLADCQALCIGARGNGRHHLCGPSCRGAGRLSGTWVLERMTP